MQPSESPVCTLSDEQFRNHLIRGQWPVHILLFVITVMVGWIVDMWAFGYFDRLMVISGDFWLPFFEIMAYMLIFYLRLVIVSLAPLVHDMAFTRLVLVWDITVILSLRVMCLFYESVWTYPIMWAIFYSRGILFTIFGIWALVSTSASQAQRRMWLGLGIFAASEIVQWSICVLWVLVEQHRLIHHVGVLPPLFLFLYIVLRPGLRRRVQGKVQDLIESQTARHSAANLASQIAAVSPAEAMATARKRFTCIRSGQLSFEMMMDVSARSVQSALVQPCAFGSCDAFVSHSYYDDGRAKCKALQAWGAAFVERSCREPLLCVDRCCIDQERGDIDLQCVPVFLRGCRHLVVLCGPTYLSCLWCIFQIVLHVYMAGSAEDIELLLVLREGSELEDRQAIVEAFDNFDARESRCFESSGQQRIFAAIEIVFGSLETFTTIAQGIVRKIRPELIVRSSLLPIVTPSTSATPEREALDCG